MGVGDAWDSFRETVEGRPSPASCTLIEGRPAYYARPIRKGTKPNLQLLADMLRSDTPIPQEIRNWLADLMDANATSEFQFKELLKRKPGAKSVSISAHWDAAQRLEQLLEERVPRKRAIKIVMDETGLGKSTIEAALSSRRSALEEHSCVVREHEEYERRKAEQAP